MANRAPSIDPVLAAIEAAPFVPATDEEKRLLAEVDGEPERWIRHDDVANRVLSRAASAERTDGE